MGEHDSNLSKSGGHYPCEFRREGVCPDYTRLLQKGYDDIRHTDLLLQDEESCQRGGGNCLIKADFEKKLLEGKVNGA